MKACLLFLGLFINFVVMPVFAYAQAAYEINVQAPLQTAIVIFFSIVSAMGGILISRFFNRNKAKLEKLQIDDNVRQYLEKALSAGLDFAASRIGSAAKGMGNPTVKNQQIAEALNYVLERVPDAVAHFKLDAKSLAKMLEARFIDKQGGSVVGNDKEFGS